MALDILSKLLSVFCRSMPNFYFTLCLNLIFRWAESFSIVFTKVSARYNLRSSAVCWIYGLRFDLIFFLTLKTRISSSLTSFLAVDYVSSNIGDGML